MNRVAEPHHFNAAQAPARKVMQFLAALAPQHDLTIFFPSVKRAVSQLCLTQIFNICQYFSPRQTGDLGDGTVRFIPVRKCSFLVL
jgi:hypothetical protein